MRGTRVQFGRRTCPLQRPGGADSVLWSRRPPEGTHSCIPVHFGEEKPQRSPWVARPGQRRADGQLCARHAPAACRSIGASTGRWVGML